MPGKGADWGDFLRRVDGAVVVLFAMVSESLGWATEALLSQDSQRAEKVMAEDRRVDEHAEALIGLVKERLALAASRPDELEDLIAVLQIVPELERSADLAEHIARRSLGGLGGAITPRCRGLIQSMNDVAVRMWHAAASAYAERSRDAGFDLAEADDELDILASQLVHEAVAEGGEPRVAAELALLARFYERSGDHAVNLARRVDAMMAPRRFPAARATPELPRRADSRASRPAWRRVLSGLMRLRIVPTDETFLDIFSASAVNARDCAEQLQKLVVSFDAVDVHYEAVKRFERTGDQLTMDLLRRLDSTFVTPYDREDIHALAEALDDVVDDMFAVAELIQLVKVTQPLPEFPDLADILVAMTGEMVELIECMRAKEGARYRLEKIESLEREGDVIYRRLMARLFGGEYEAIEILKWKDIIQALEDSLNKVEDVSDVVESILVKNS